MVSRQERWTCALDQGGSAPRRTCVDRWERLGRADFEGSWGACERCCDKGEARNGVPLMVGRCGMDVR